MTKKELRTQLSELSNFLETQVDILTIVYNWVLSRGYKSLILIRPTRKILS
ncbi:hypothetical protein NIES4073_55230 [Kalymmatonema gypsitolerans NIES-4073]|nr:hypothetical protein NIES4073_55230 [Scytonema sp. NIES-4073]